MVEWLICIVTTLRQRLGRHCPTGDIEIPGRGGAGFMPSNDGKYLFVVGGFAGKEMNDVYRYDIEAQTMSKIYEQDDEQETNPLRPFSVSCGGVLHGLIHYFGGEVNPSQKGHEGAGGFSNKVQVLNGVTGKMESKLPRSVVRLRVIVAGQMPQCCMKTMRKNL